MSRRDQPPGNEGLREYLAGFIRQVRDTYGHVDPVIWETWDRKAAEIEAGVPYQLNRYELPEGHPLSAPAGGDPCDLLVPTEDDELRLA